MIALNKKGRPKHCYHVWVQSVSPGYRMCEKCKAVEKVEKRPQNA